MAEPTCPPHRWVLEMGFAAVGRCQVCGAEREFVPREKRGVITPPRVGRGAACITPPPRPR